MNAWRAEICFFISLFSAPVVEPCIVTVGASSKTNKIVWDGMTKNEVGWKDMECSGMKWNMQAMWEASPSEAKDTVQS